jgi:hypothetical protein
MISEKQELENKREREIRCGKILWSSIAFVLYAVLYISIIIIQLGVDRNYTYNYSMKHHIETMGEIEEGGLGLSDV